MSQFPDEHTEDGAFDRQEDAFRDWIENSESAKFPAVPNRYHLYVSLACPWAHRTIIYRKVKELEEIIGMTVVDPIREDDTGWAFREGPGCSRDPVNGFAFLKEAYLASDPNYKGRVTVPALTRMKRAGEKIAMLTAYDHPFAQRLDAVDEARHEFGIDLEQASISEASKVIDHLKSLQGSSTNGSRR